MKIFLFNGMSTPYGLYKAKIWLICKSWVFWFQIIFDNQNIFRWEKFVQSQLENIKINHL